ncbi:MAG: hypothetical protein ACLFVR_16335 [Thiohalospira sp.]
MRANTHFTPQYITEHFFEDNEQLVAADKKNTKWFARSDLHHTDFIEVDKKFIIAFNDINKKGFDLENDVDDNLVNEIRNADFRNGQYVSENGAPAPYGGGKVDGIPSNSTDTNYYFYKGFGESDCIDFIISLGLV